MVCFRFCFLFGRTSVLVGSFLTNADWGRAVKNALQEFLSSPADREGSASFHLEAFSDRI
jgi:hypothetical protein